MTRNAFETALERLPAASLAAPTRRYAPGFNLRPFTRPVKWKRFAPAVLARVKLPSVTVRLHLCLPRFFFVGLTQRLPALRPARFSCTLNETVEASLSV